MKTTMEVKTVVKQQNGKTLAWFNGQVVEVYFRGPTLNGSPAKVIVRNRKDGTAKFIAGKVYLDNELKVYFLQNEK